jgi:hypothetical protein
MMTDKNRVRSIFLAISGIFWMTGTSRTPAAFAGDSPALQTPCPGGNPDQMRDQLKVDAFISTDTAHFGTSVQYSVYYARVSLQNNNSDPFSYNTFSCSEFESWKTDKRFARIYSWPCLANTPNTRTIPPGKAYSFILPIRVKDIEKGRSFRIGFTARQTCQKSRTPRTIWSPDLQLPTGQP